MKSAKSCNKMVVIEKKGQKKRIMHSIETKRADSQIKYKITK